MNKLFFKEGNNFKCQGSSNCCVSRGNFGFVYLSAKDVYRITNNFKISKK